MARARFSILGPFEKDVDLGVYCGGVLGTFLRVLIVENDFPEIWWWMNQGALWPVKILC